MGEFFKLFGIAIAVLFVDVLFCGIILSVNDALGDDDWYLLPLIVNVFGFAVVTAILLGGRMG